MDNIELHILSNWGAHVPKPRVVAEHWVKHYRNLGADNITILLHSPKQDEKYENMHDFLTERGVDTIIPWIGPFPAKGRTKRYNKRIIPHKFKNITETKMWIMTPDDDELFSLTPNIADAKAYLSNVENTLPNQKTFISGHRINMKRCDESIPDEVLSDVSIYEQFPCEFPAESFLYSPTRRPNVKVRNNINKVIAVNFKARFRQGQHSIRDVKHNKVLWRHNLDMENLVNVGGLSVYYHDDNIVEVVHEGGAYEYKHYKWDNSYKGR